MKEHFLDVFVVFTGKCAIEGEVMKMRPKSARVRNWPENSDSNLLYILQLKITQRKI